MPFRLSNTSGGFQQERTFAHSSELTDIRARLIDSRTTAFIDKECALLLTQGRPGKELNFRARIFSLTNREEFLAYLRQLEADASDEVRRYAKVIYGIDIA